jgi:hypothetical protein
MRSPSVGRLRRCTFEDLYEQCSDHMTEYVAELGGRRLAAEGLDDAVVLVVGQAELGGELPPASPGSRGCSVGSSPCAPSR